MEKRNITVAVSDSAYRSARHWAAKHDTSISAIVEGCIERLPGLKVAQETVAEIKRGKHRSHRSHLPPGLLALSRAAQRVLNENPELFEQFQDAAAQRRFMTILAKLERFFAKN